MITVAYMLFRVKRMFNVRILSKINALFTVAPSKAEWLFNIISHVYSIENSAA